MSLVPLDNCDISMLCPDGTVSRHMLLGSEPISDLPPRIYVDLYRELDCDDNNKNWKALQRLMHRVFAGSTFETSLKGVEDGQSAIRCLGSFNCDVSTLIQYLDIMRQEKAVSLLKAEEPVVILQDPQPAILANCGDDIVVRCEARGLPYPKYQWYKGELGGEGDSGPPQLMPGETNNELFVRVTADTDSTYYRCCAYNYLSHAYSEASLVRVSMVPTLPDHINALGLQDNIFVEDPPVPHYVGLPPCITTQLVTNASGRLGEVVMLRCSGIGYPMVTYQWFHNHVPLVRSPYVSEVDTSELYITHLLPQHGGEYYCVLANMAGRVKSGMCKLDVIVPDNFSNTSLPYIYRQPLLPSQSYINNGASFDLECFAITGDNSAVRYHWYQNGKHLPWATAPELKLKNVNKSDNGTYKCVITNDSGAVDSADVVVTVLDDKQEIVANRRPTDKIALVIGNRDYNDSIGRLRSPRNDAYHLSEKLRNLGFKVICVINYNHAEMREIIKKFSELLQPGVYAVFYFGGHGFQENGDNYLVPIDARSNYLIEQCISLSYILDCLQDADSALNLLILDMCRNSRPADIQRADPGRQDPSLGSGPRRNLAIFYATCAKWKAYERGGNSVFMTHLLRHIGERKPYTDVLASVQWDIQAAGYDMYDQAPEYTTNIALPLSLCDPVSSAAAAGGTDSIINNYFTRISNLPPNINERFAIHTVLSTGHQQSFSATVNIKFSQHLSNVLGVNIKVSTEETGSNLRDSVHIEGVDDTGVGLIFEPYQNEAETGRDNVYVIQYYIHNLQKRNNARRHNLPITFNIYFEGSVDVCKHPIKINLNDVLISKLN